MAYEFLKHRGQLAVHTSILELHSAEVDGEGVCAHHLLQPRDQHRPAPGRRPVRDEQAMVAPGRRAEQRGRCISAESVRDQPFPREQALLVLRTIARERDGDDPMNKRNTTGIIFPVRCGTARPIRPGGATPRRSTGR